MLFVLYFYFGLSSKCLDRKGNTSYGEMQFEVRV